MKSLTYNVIVSVAVILSLTRTCRALAPPMSTTTRTCAANRESFGSSCSGGVTRRAAALSLIGSVLATGVITPGLVFATTDDNDAEAAAAAAAKERMRQRIADSKKNYRKSTDLVQQRKDTTDYSCVSETGSPCPEGLVPRAVQREIIGALEKK
jgi:histidine ammonia-lyase